jgi:predicted phosphodiesterase
MKRRAFLKTIVFTASAALVNRLFATANAQNVDDPIPEPYAKTVPLTKIDAPAGTWTLAVLPDTQYYSEKYPDVFARQTEWIVANRERQNIRFVAHEGDLVNNPTVTSQWENAQKAMKVLVEGGVPFSVVLGNHDSGTQHEGRTKSRVTLLNNYLHESDYKNSEAYALFEPGKLENSWHEFSTSTGKHLLLALEFGPRDEALAWANDILTQKPDHKVIVVTHAFLYTDNKRNDWAFDKTSGGRGNPKSFPFAKDGDMNDAQDIWDKLITKHPHVSFVLNGHVCDSGVGYLASKADAGQTVHQILANYQDNSPNPGGTVQPPRGYGGGGYLRLMQFHPDGKTVHIRSYSPWYDKYLSEPEQDFKVSV